MRTIDVVLKLVKSYLRGKQEARRDLNGQEMLVKRLIIEITFTLKNLNNTKLPVTR